MMNETIEHLIAGPSDRKHETPIFLQHGAFHNAACWEQFMDYLAELGYEVYAISMPGHSFGGWTTLMTTKSDTRIKAALPLAPGGGKSPLYGKDNPTTKMLTLDWERTVPTLYLTAEFDTLLPLDGMKDMLDRTPEPKGMVVLLNADHFHFCDGVEVVHDFFRQMGGFVGGMDPGGESEPAPMKKAKPSSELCSGKDAYTFIQGIGLAHMDAHLKGNSDAMELLKGDIAALLADRGVKVEVIPG